MGKINYVGNFQYLIRPGIAYSGENRKIIESFFYNEIVEWCHENTENDWEPGYTSYIFKSEKDAALFKLRWGFNC